ncbi:NADH dehydrogenase [ubiquinone] 1 beta subcomplex subunit 6 [Hyperolius riggenbachi]|uniref:NADH dehydrogenase [ubiquinone] 1 beta subcomplex subunit 6 n=1 Tax=Hyperolius riggenbachi TaxID=752182 RepID=UPI0035A2F28A
MAVSPADEKLRLQQLRALRRKWLKDQELSPREPVLPPQKLGPVERFWSNFLKDKSLWRLYTFKTYNFGVSAFKRIIIPVWIVHYFVKYHMTKVPYGIQYQKPRLYPGDVIKETGEVIPPMEEPASSHHHHH